MKKWIKIGVIFTLIIAVGAIFYNKVYIPKTTYKTVKPQIKTIKQEVFGIGEVDAKDIYPIGAQIGGKIIKLTKDQGDWVKKSELIAKIDSVDLPDKIESAKSALQKAKLQVKISKDNLRALKAKVRLAKAVYLRTLKLYKKSFASKEEYDRDKANLDNLNAQIGATASKIESAKLEIKSLQKSIDAMETKLSIFTILSPIYGYVIKRNAQLDQTIMPAMPIVTIVDPKTVWVKINIDEHISGRVKIGQKATIILRSHSNTPLSGKVARIEAQSDPITQERIVDIAFDKIPKPFYLKERAEATISTGYIQNALTIPLKALSQKDGKSGVWIVKESKAHFQPLKVLTSTDSSVAVEGLKKSATILLPSSKKKALKEGMKIHL